MASMSASMMAMGFRSWLDQFSSDQYAQQALDAGRVRIEPSTISGSTAAHAIIPTARR